jgi:hypothetical protein
MARIKSGPTHFSSTIPLKKTLVDAFKGNTFSTIKRPAVKPKAPAKFKPKPSSNGIGVGP